MMQPLSGLRIGLVTSSASRLGGGVFEAVVAHAEMIYALGGEASVFALRDACSEVDRPRFKEATVQLAEIAGPRQIGFAPGLDKALATARLDCLHLHGIWMYPSAAASRWAHRTGKPYFISPHGMLDPWITARGKWKKALARHFYEQASWRRATAFHALTNREARDIARESTREDCIVIPNAGPVPLERPRSAMPAPVMAYIGRIHPKKNLLAMVHGWHLASRPNGARLVIAGWGDEACISELRMAIESGDGSVEFVGPVYGTDKALLLKTARFVILPSHSEGLPMAMLEAWAGGVPTIMTAECNLPEGFSAGAARPCGYDPEGIARSVQDALALAPQEWQQMSTAALRLARERFSAKTVGMAWADAYLGAIRGKARG